MSRKNLLDDDAAQYDDVVGRLRRLEQGGPEPPHYVGATDEPAFQNSWVNYDAAAPPVGRAAFFYRYNGRVYLGGKITSGASGTSVFTLPVEYRPTNALALPISADTDLALIIIGTDGSVRPTNQGASSVASSASLEGVSFRHA